MLSFPSEEQNQTPTHGIIACHIVFENPGNQIPRLGVFKMQLAAE